MKILKARTSDVSRLYALERRLFKAENFPLSKGSLYYHVKHNLLLMAQTAEGEIAGYALLLVNRREPKLYSLGVDPDYRGQKIALSLMEVVSQELISLGFKAMLLEVRKDNVEALSLYKKLGFSVLKTIEAFYLDGCDAYLMRRTYGD